VLGRGQRPAGLPGLAGQPFALSEAPADGGGEAAGPTPHDQPPGIVVGQPEQRVGGTGQPGRAGHDQLLQVVELRRAGRDGRRPGGVGDCPRPLGPGVDPHGRHAPFFPATGRACSTRLPWASIHPSGRVARWRRSPDTLPRVLPAGECCGARLSYGPASRSRSSWEAAAGTGGCPGGPKAPGRSGGGPPSRRADRNAASAATR
jgi:hypothetical protein